jgi:beta-lactamase regulating signal transducer with metallopeptidase domain
VDLLFNLDRYIMLACWIAGIPVGAYAFIHAIRCRPDAFTAADKLTKPAWLAITGGGTALLVICQGGPMTLVWVIGLIAVLVYLVDVRPSLIEVQGGRR